MHTKEEILKHYPDVDVNEEGGADAFKEGLPVIERDPIAVVIKHPTEEMYLLADWKGVEWVGFLTGGVEAGDTLEQTVSKEVHEETGYKHLSKIIPADFASHGLFFHPIKNVNRLAHYHFVFAQLADLEQDPVAEEEKAIAEFVWIPREKVLDAITRKSMKALWNFYIENPHLFE